MPLEPKSRKAIALLAALLFALLISRMVKDEHLSDGPFAAPVVVEVLGDVRAPGVFLIDSGKPFLKEALSAAGLSTASAPIIDAAGQDIASLPLRSGQSVLVKSLSEDGFRVDISLMPAAARLVVGEKLDLNEAAEEDFLLVPGMRPDLASAIVSRRGSSLWTGLDDLQKIPGVGPKLVQRWKGYLEVR